MRVWVLVSFVNLFFWIWLNQMETFLKLFLDLPWRHRSFKFWTNTYSCSYATKKSFHRFRNKFCNLIFETSRTESITKSFSAVPLVTWINVVNEGWLSYVTPSTTARIHCTKIFFQCLFQSTSRMWLSKIFITNNWSSSRSNLWLMYRFFLFWNIIFHNLSPRIECDIVSEVMKRSNFSFLCL